MPAAAVLFGFCTGIGGAHTDANDHSNADDAAITPTYRCPNTDADPSPNGDSTADNDAGS